jgi:hypothetical protein
MNIKIGDVVKTDGGEDFEITELSGCSKMCPGHIRGIDHADGEYGLIGPSDITHINGKPVNEQPEKKVYAMAPEACRDWLTPGKVYECLEPNGMVDFTVVDNQGDIIGCNWKVDENLYGGDWTRLELTKAEAALINAKVDAANADDVTTKPIDLERLANDRAYWDEVAPEGAEWYAPDSLHDSEGWYKKTERGHEFLLSPKHAWVPAHSFNRRTLIPRPSPAWNGEGLPPVGVECEYNAHYGYAAVSPTSEWDDGDELDVLAHRSLAGRPELVICFNKRKGTASGVITGCLRPLKTEKERVVEAVMEVAGFGENMRHGLNKAFEAKALRMPKGEK